MSDLSFLKNLLEKAIFPNYQQKIIDLGYKLVDFLLFKVTTIKLNDGKLYQILNNCITSTIIQELGMTLGYVVKRCKYQHLQKIENQILEVVKRIKERLMSRNQNILNKTQQASHGTSFSNYKIQFQQQNNVSLATNKMQESQISRIYPKFSPQQPSQQVSTFSIPSFSSLVSEKIPDSPYNLLEDIQQHIKNMKNCNTQLNSLIQKHKLTPGNWTEKKDGSYFKLMRKIQIPGLLMYKNHNVVIQEQGQGTNKDEAKKNANINILRKLFSISPHIFQFSKQNNS